MGREVRRVPPDWAHPFFTEEDAPNLRSIGEYRPCYDEDFETAARRWISDLNSCPVDEEGVYLWEDESPPDRRRYRPAFTSEPTWYQMYEDVSEGTPVTPPFATQEELALYLHKHGDFWHQRHPDESSKSSYEDALSTVKRGHAFSMVVSNVTGVLGPYEQSKIKK